jgi:NAD(P)-dependent dehydrogenase (short-subunit alcohol dehydrogenase family)
MPFQLTNKSALVTGAGSGIGAAIAETFARAGAHVFVTDINLAAATETAGRIAEAGGSAAPLTLDVRDERACEAIAARTGTVDILANNAGVGHVGTVLTTAGADLDRLYGINVRGVFNLSKVYLPARVRRGAGVRV